MKELFDSISSAMSTLDKEIAANITGNKAAGVRARKLTLELEKLFKEYRKRSIEAAKA